MECTSENEFLHPELMKYKRPNNLEIETDYNYFETPSTISQDTSVVTKPKDEDVSKKKKM